MSLPSLYAIVDVDVAQRAGWAPQDLASAYLAGGVRFLQLRAKSLGGAAFLHVAQAIVREAERHEAIVIVNDRTDMAMLSGASGVHVGQEDLSPEAARRLMGPAAIVGVSTHTASQVAASAGAAVSYIAVGPVFGTSTKDTGYPAVGLDLVRAAARIGRPVVGIGGITIDNAQAVLDAGAEAVSVISDLLVGGDPEARVRTWLARLAGPASPSNSEKGPMQRV